MNDILDIFDLTELTGIAGKEFIPPVDGCPLELLPIWSLINNPSGGQSHFCYKNSGETIVFTDFPNTQADVQNLSYKGYTGEGAVIEFDVLFAPTGNINWALFAVKFLNENNIIGVRINSDSVEVVQRKIGTWTTISSTAATPILGHWIVTITNNSISLEIEGNAVVTENHTISGVGKFGLSGHRWEQGTIDMLQNFDVVVTN